MADEKTRVISKNDLHVIMTQFLNAASSIHVAMCLFDDDHRAQENLNSALSSSLIGAQQCAQLHKSQKLVVTKPGDPEFSSED